MARLLLKARVSFAVADGFPARIRATGVSGAAAKLSAWRSERAGPKEGE
jgi:hypothetical protein